MCGVCSPGQASEDVLHVGVVSSRLGDGDTQLGVAQRPDGGDDAGDDPHDQGHAHRAGVLQHALRTDEDTRADDVTWWRKDRDSQVTAQTEKEIGVEVTGGLVLDESCLRR